MCGNCCSGPPGYVWMNEEEINQLALRFGIEPAEFLRGYARRIHGNWSLKERKTKHGMDCIFLERGEDGLARCGVYEDRPSQCRTWPFWPELLESRESFESAAETCPGLRKGLTGEGKHYDFVQIRIQRDAT